MKDDLNNNQETYTMKEIVMWNCIWNLCINSHIVLLIALLMAHKERFYTYEVRTATHKEVNNVCTIKWIEFLKNLKIWKPICDDNKMMNGHSPMVGSPIVEKDSVGSGE